ncbi:MAG: protein TolQ [Rickettsiaceae bacterium]|nr:MAG: protein TolQ [Rickettsiaceae bacterium]
MITMSDNINYTTNIVADNSSSIISMISSADLMSKSVMFILAIASVWSWTIIFEKLFVFGKMRKKIKEFESFFWSGQALDQLYEAARQKMDNPLAAIFINAMNECKRSDNNKTDSLFKIGHKERVFFGMNLMRDREIEKMEKNMGFIAIVGSNALFVGLFGTVWGIMHSFQSIASSKNTSLAVVAPGIAEALLATAIGLIAAVPCVIFYSYFITQINSMCNRIDNFIGELNSILSRAIDEGKI